MLPALPDPPGFRKWKVGVRSEVAVASGAADMIAIGRPYLSNPDLVERYANDWPLAPLPEMEAWYTPAGAEGYTDFPVYSE